MMSGYINVAQARSCRIIKGVSPAFIQGLYTDNISECNVLILRKANKMSLTHVDRWTQRSQIQTEMDWVGENPQIILLTKDDFKQNIVFNTVLIDLIGQLKIIHRTFPLDKFGVSFSFDSKLRYYERTALPELICHPHEHLLHHTYTMNRYFYDNDLGITPILFDVDAWALPNTSDFQLGAKTQRYYDAMKEELNPSFPLSYTGVLKATLQYFALNSQSIDKTNMAILSQGFLLIYSDNDYQNIFTDELRYIIDLSAKSGLVPAFQMMLLGQLLEFCQEDFRNLITEDNLERVSLLQTSAQASITGSYKLMYRFWKHTTDREFEEHTQIRFKPAGNP
jgi:hypothetical protein